MARARRAALGVAIGIAAVTTVVGIFIARCYVEGDREMAASDAAFHRGDVRTAALHARRAAVLQAPGAPHVEPAYARLAAIAVGSEARGDLHAARLAWRSIRGAALETRHVRIARREELDRANANLARLAVGAGDGTAGGGGAHAAVRRRARAALERDDAPRAPFVGLLLGGFGLMAAGLVLGGLDGLRGDGSLRWRRAIAPLVAACLGLACWTIAIWQA